MLEHFELQESQPSNPVFFTSFILSVITPSLVKRFTLFSSSIHINPSDEERISFKTELDLLGKPGHLDR